VQSCVSPPPFPHLRWTAVPESASCSYLSLLDGFVGRSPFSPLRFGDQFFFFLEPLVKVFPLFLSLCSYLRFTFCHGMPSNSVTGQSPLLFLFLSISSSPLSLLGDFDPNLFFLVFPRNKFNPSTQTSLLKGTPQFSSFFLFLFRGSLLADPPPRLTSYLYSRSLTAQFKVIFLTDVRHHRFFAFPLSLYPDSLFLPLC